LKQKENKGSQAAETEAGESEKKQVESQKPTPERSVRHKRTSKKSDQ